MEEEKCEECNDSGYIEIMGDGENFEWDVVGTQRCPECNNQEDELKHPDNC